MFLNKLLKITLLTSLCSVVLFASPIISKEIKEKKIYPMGKKIYEKRCKELKLHNYKSYEALSSDLANSKVCGKLNAKHLQALSLYLWDVKRNSLEELQAITVTKDEKCQVCGMYLHYYPNWICEIDYPHNEIYKFDGVKDMMKFYFNNEEGISRVVVKDYYTLKSIDARKAYFVVGSDVLGPMGNELIPFKDKKSAMTFALDHNGNSPLSFDELNEKMVRSIE